MNAHYYINISHVSELESLREVYLNQPVCAVIGNSLTQQKVRRVYEFIRDNNIVDLKEVVFDKTIPYWVRHCGSAFLSLHPQNTDLDFLVDVANSKHVMGCMSGESVVGIAKLAVAGNSKAQKQLHQLGQSGHIVAKNITCEAIKHFEI